MPPFALHPLAVHVSSPPMNHRIINRYLIREIGSIFLLGLAIFTMVLLMGKMVKLIEMVVTNGLPITDVLKMIAYLLPAFLVFTIPIAFLLAVLLAIGRFSIDNEIVILKASGIDLLEILKPVLFLAFVVTGVALWISLVAAPWGNAEFKVFAIEVVRKHASASIKERIFRDDLPGLVIYVEQYNEAKRKMKNVMIYDSRNEERPLTIFAQSGLVNTDDESGSFKIILFDGSIHAASMNNYRLVSFRDYLVSIDSSKSIPLKVTEQDRRTKELLKDLTGNSKLTNSLKAAIELYGRLSLPFATVVFSLIAVPLGLQNRRSGKGAGFAISIAVLISYYVVLSFFKAQAEKGAIPALVALSLPNIIFLIAGMYLFMRAYREKPPIDFLLLFKRFHQ